jgi:multidrug efflux system outer membrane protein
MRRLDLVPCLLATALAGCTLGPDYQRPETAAPASFRSAAATGPADPTLADGAWWAQWNDPVLATLVNEALAANLDVVAAAARVDQLHGAAITSRGQMAPQVGAEAAGTRQRITDLQAGSARNPSTVYQADVFASWEIDLFGRLRRLNESAQADYLAAEAARRGVLLSVVSATVASYLNLRDLDNRLLISRRTVATREDALKLFTRRYEGGVVSEVELNQARSEYAAAQATVPQLERSIIVQENALSLLLGRPPGPIERGAPIDTLAAPAVPPGLPSDLLERRPDLQQAERQLVSANARIGAAKALYFPRISLTGAFGGASPTFSSLWDGPSRVWSFAGAVTVPIFSGGTIAGQVESAEAAQREAVAAYRRAVLAAFQDTDDALIGVRKSVETRDAIQVQVDSLARYAGLSRRKYEGGYTSYLEVLDAERSLFSAQLQYSQAQADVLLQRVALIRALGGPWVDAADRLAPQPVSAAASR